MSLNHRQFFKRILECHHNALAERYQRSLNLFWLSIVLGVQHAPDYRFADAEALGKLGVRHAAFTQSKVQRKLRRKIERNADKLLPTLGSPWQKSKSTAY